MRPLFWGIGVIGLLLWVPASLVLYFYYWLVLASWLGGGLGAVVALVAAPGFLVFPLIYWIVQGTFPALYFLLIGVTLVGAWLCAWGFGSLLER